MPSSQRSSRGHPNLGDEGTIPLNRTVRPYLSLRTSIDCILGRQNFRLVETTYDLRWTGRFLFTFVPSGSRAGGVIVFPMALDSTAEVSQSRIGLHVLAFAKGWSCSLISQLSPWVRWSPETGQVGSLSPNQKYDPANVHETTPA